MKNKRDEETKRSLEEKATSFVEAIKKAKEENSDLTVLKQLSACLRYYQFHIKEILEKAKEEKESIGAIAHIRMLLIRINDTYASARVIEMEDGLLYHSELISRGDLKVEEDEK